MKTTKQTWTKNDTRQNLIDFYNELSAVLFELQRKDNKLPSIKVIKKACKPILDKWVGIIDGIETKAGITKYVTMKFNK